jgi:hypothetical protein
MLQLFDFFTYNAISAWWLFGKLPASLARDFCGVLNISVFNAL